MLLALFFLSAVCHEPIFVLKNVFTLQAWCLLSTRLVLKLTMGDLRHWPSIANMAPKSHCGDEEDVPVGMTSLYVHYPLRYVLVERSVFNEPILF